MSKKQDEQSAIPQSLLNEINKLSPEKQDAIRFLIQNIDIVEQMSEKDPHIRLSSQGNPGKGQVGW